MQSEAGQLLIGGEWGPAADGRRRDVLDPATGELVTTVAEAGAADVARAAAGHGIAIQHMA